MMRCASRYDSVAGAGPMRTRVVHCREVKRARRRRRSRRRAGRSRVRAPRARCAPRSRRGWRSSSRRIGRRSLTVSTPANGARGTRAGLPVPRASCADARSRAPVYSSVSSYGVADDGGDQIASPRRSRSDSPRAPLRRCGRRPRRARRPATTSCTSPIVERAAGVEAFAGQEQRARVRSADLGDDERRDHRRQDAEFRLGEPEDRPFGGDDDVADRREPRTAAQRGAVDAADDRFRHAVDRAVHARQAARVLDVLALAQIERGAHPVDVGAAGKDLAGAGEHDRADGVVARRVRERGRAARRSALR